MQWLATKACLAAGHIFARQRVTFPRLSAWQPVPSAEARQGNARRRAGSRAAWSGRPACGGVPPSRSRRCAAPALTQPMSEAPLRKRQGLPQRRMTHHSRQAVRWLGTGEEFTAGCRGVGFRVSGFGFRVQGLGFRVQGLGISERGIAASRGTCRRRMRATPVTHATSHRDTSGAHAVLCSQHLLDTKRLH